MNKLLKEIKGASYERGHVRRFWNPEDDKMKTLGIACSDKQARLIKRLAGSMSYDDCKARGFTDAERQEISNMYETI